MEILITILFVIAILFFLGTRFNEVRKARKNHVSSTSVHVEKCKEDND